MNIDLSTIGEFIIHCTSISTIVCNLDDNLIHSKYYNGYETLNEYDSKGNRFHYKNNTGVDLWFNSQGNEVSEDEYYCFRVYSSQDYAKRHPPVPLT